MSYQVTLNSRNVLVPIALENRQGERMNEPLLKLETATAMVILVSAGGGFTQEFFPLKISQDTTQAYGGLDWELLVQKAGAELLTYYLGVPDRFFALDEEGREPRSLSIQVVGTSPMTGREDFTGGVDVTLLAQVKPPLIPGFLNLSERFFPTLLPHNFIERHVMDAFEFRGKSRLVLMATLQIDPADRLPVSLEKHWDSKQWMLSVVENLAPMDEKGAYFVIRGGCFYARNRKITHWFGNGIGLEEKSFRQAASEKIREMGGSGNGAWVFWLEPQAMREPEAEVVLGKLKAKPRAHFAIRHPMMHRLLTYRNMGDTQISQATPLANSRLSAGETIAALSHVARILVNHQDALHRVKSEPSHALWSESRIQSPLEAILGKGESPLDPGQNLLDAAIRELYRVHGETLRELESVFDETYGYSAWDAVGNPMRDTLSEFLAEKGTDARSPA